MKADKSSPGAPPASIQWQGPSHGFVSRGAARLPFTAVRVGSAVWVRHEGRTHVVEGAGPEEMPLSGAASGSSRPTSPMPGVVLAVPVVEGQRVSGGDLLVSIEAMKMEHEIRAAAPAVLERLHVKEGQRVEAGTVLCTLRFEAGGQP